MRTHGYYWISNGGKPPEVALWFEMFKEWHLAGELYGIPDDTDVDVLSGRLTPTKEAL